MTTVSKEQEIDRGRRAAELLDNDIFKAAVESLESEYVRAWKETASADEQGRERIFLALQVSRDFVQHLNTMIASGKITAQQMQRLRTPK
jgi:hypothetical protein